MAAHHRRTSSISSFGDMDPHGASPLRARKMSTGGNRSWSEEEEAYLLQTRMQKMPYKHIAQHLKKTELACRLHYHQLSHGSHRRKRNASISSTTSSIVSGSTNTTPSQFELPTEIAEEYTQTMTPPRQESPMMTIEAHQQKILLPRLHPRIITPQSSPEPRMDLRIDTNPGTVHSNANSASTMSAASGMMMPFHHHGYQQESQRLPSTLTNPSDGHSRHHSRASSLGPVDTARLRNIYEAHRTAFWAAVAADYGPDASAAQLEDVWRQGGSGSPLCPSFFNKSDKGLGLHIPRPPTPPGESPKGTTLGMGSLQAQLPLPSFKTSGWAAVNKQEPVGSSERRESRTAISALLTEERDPRP
ncbi:hypothetical protein BFW01_g6453 [Lasiodiplodia theobromae]|uniref:Myb-like domain-containing protein n=1 Tax=Lasiodiplodia theobromae TaxID=45133 RepID=A0A5N5D9Z0_9PEZI|nr:uncharacterized protein LTHEOB_11243 [Lasiodiplodia theobromae]KAB2574588.1 hypothetical protein DBV05_g6792 [Lasiodiplodia theobromae]KAF4537923.1 hypothetical protein LTHEOB_11243 [Lasiodiplodia theobromae]KAF9635558.1 hypothetical protein BFW01_g6453 [Lasiodiplodia theobromae]